jgi:nicotinamidase-related amidase
MSKKALILVDFENEWLDKNSDYYIDHNISDVLENTNKLIDFCRSQDIKIIFIKHVEKDSQSAFIENSENTKIIQSLHKKNEDVIIKKYKISPFFKTNLEEELANKDEIIVSRILANL